MSGIATTVVVGAVTVLALSIYLAWRAGASKDERRAFGERRVFVGFIAVVCVFAAGSLAGEPFDDAMAMSAVSGVSILLGTTLVRRLRPEEGFWATTIRRGVILAAVLVVFLAVASTVAWIASEEVRAADGNRLGTTLMNGTMLALYLAPGAVVVAAGWTGVTWLRRRRRGRHPDAGAKLASE